jgi:hypothetical protein
VVWSLVDQAQGDGCFFDPTEAVGHVEILGKRLSARLTRFGPLLQATVNASPSEWVVIQ